MPIVTPNGNLYTVAEVSKKTDMSEDQVYQEIKKGALKACLKRGTTKPYLIKEKFLGDWYDSGLELVGGEND